MLPTNMTMRCAVTGRTYLLADFCLVIRPKCTDEVFLLGNLTFGNIYKH